MFSQLTQKYPLTKTLRFELKPIGKTLQNLQSAMKWDPVIQTFLKDQAIEDAYQVIKPVLDALHSEFITNCMESKEAQLLDIAKYANEYRNLRTISEKSQKRGIEQVLEKEEKELRKFFLKLYEIEGENFKKKIVKTDKKGKVSSIFKNNSFKVLTEAAILKYIKMRFLSEDENGITEIEKLDLKTRDGKIVTKNLLELALGSNDSKGIFEGFFTYLSGFNENRENYYSVDDKSTAVANRIVAENLPKFLDNVFEFEKRRDEIVNIVTFLESKNIDLKAKDQNGNETRLHPIPDKIFKVDYFCFCLSQKQIDAYNLEIGNANNLINRYNQQKQSEKNFQKIRKFKVLYKQIGCGERKEFIQDIKSDTELLSILNKIKDDGMVYFEEIKNFCDQMLSLEDFEGIYLSDKALNTISSKYFLNWNLLKEKLLDSKVFKKDKDQIKIPRTIELCELFQALANENKDIIFKQSFNDNNDKKLNILRSNDNNLVILLKMIFVDILENYNTFTKLKTELPEDNFKKDGNTVIIKTWLDSILNSNQILKYFKVQENKITGQSLNPEIYVLLENILNPETNPTQYYDLIRNYLTKKPTQSLNKLKLNFNNSVLADGWDMNKEIDRWCLILKDGTKKYFAVLTKSSTHLFGEKAKYKEISSTENYLKMDYKLIPGPNKMLPKVLLPKKNRYQFGATDEITNVYDEGGFKKNQESFTKDKLSLIIDFYKKGLKIYPSNKNSWNDTFNFKFKNTSDYNGIDEFYWDVEKQGYKLQWSNISKELIDNAVENGEIYLFEIKNKDNNLKDGNIKSSAKNLHSIYWDAVFDMAINRPKLNGGAEIFYRPPVRELGKKKDKKGKDVIDHKRFSEEKFMLHCPITLNFGSKASKLNDEINTLAVLNKNDICFIGIDRGEKHLAYYSIINQEGTILDQGSLNEINGVNYANKLEEIAHNRDEARKNWKTIGTIKELKEGYISQIVRKIVDLAIKHNAFIILEDLNIGFKRGRQKIEKSVYQKLELAIAKKLNFVVDKKVADGMPGSVQNALQLTPSVSNFQDIGKQCGIMLYVRANYTSQTDPVTGWRKTIYFRSTKENDLANEIKKTFSEIGYDGKDFYFKYKTKYGKVNGKEWILWSGKDGIGLDRYRNTRGEGDKNIWVPKKQDIPEILFGVFGSDIVPTKELLDKITPKNAKVVKNALDLIQQIRNSGIDPIDNDFIQSPVRSNNGNHFDSREPNAIVPNGDANGAYNIARKGLLAFEKIEKSIKSANGGKINYDLYIDDKQWDEFLAR